MSATGRKDVYKRQALYSAWRNMESKIGRVKRIKGRRIGPEVNALFCAGCAIKPPSFCQDDCRKSISIPEKEFAGSV